VRPSDALLSTDGHRPERWPERSPSSSCLPGCQRFRYHEPTPAGDVPRIRRRGHRPQATIVPNPARARSARTPTLIGDLGCAGFGRRPSGW